MIHHRLARATTTGLLGAVLVAGCGAVEEARDTAGEAIDRVEFCAAALRIVQAVDARDVDAAIAAGEDLAANAPDDVADDAQVVLDAARRARDGDLAALDDPGVRAAADELRATAERDCDPRS